MAESAQRQRKPQADHGKGRQAGQERPSLPAADGLSADFLKLQRAAGNRAVSELVSGAGEGAPPLQAKLIVGQPADRFEQEADRAAARVLQSSADAPGGPLKGRAFPQTRGIQRQMLEEEEEEEQLPEAVPETETQSNSEEEPEEDELLQAKGASGSSPPVDGHMQSQIDGARGQGKSMAPAQQSFFGSRFGFDFSRTHLHTGSRAVQLARALRARAFTVGRDIFFGEGQYEPQTSTGQHLLAHELAHVVQQSREPRHVLRRAPDDEKKSKRRKAYDRYRAKGGKLSYRDWLKERISAGKYGPGAIRRHHLVPQEFTRRLKGGKYKHPAVARRLAKLDIDIHRLVIDIPNDVHNKIHKGKWNAELKEWFAKNPNFTKKQLQGQINSMLKKHGVPRRYWPPVERYGRKPRSGEFYRRRRERKKKYKRRAAAGERAAKKKPPPTTTPPTKTPVKPKASVTPKTPAPKAPTTPKAPTPPKTPVTPKVPKGKLRAPKIPRLPRRIGARFRAGAKGAAGALAALVLQYLLSKWMADIEQEIVQEQIDKLRPKIEKKLQEALVAKGDELIKLLEANPDADIYVNVTFELHRFVSHQPEGSIESFPVVEIGDVGYSLKPWGPTPDRVEFVACIQQVNIETVTVSDKVPVKEFFEE